MRAMKELPRLSNGVTSAPPGSHGNLLRILCALAPDDFHQEGYFEAYVKYIDVRRRARVVGEDPELVEFQPPVFEDDDLREPEDTAPIDGEVAVNEGSDDMVARNEGNNDEDATF